MKAEQIQNLRKLISDITNPVIDSSNPSMACHVVSEIVNVIQSNYVIYPKRDK
jgi:hypothetical protein